MAAGGQGVLFVFEGHHFFPDAADLLPQLFGLLGAGCAELAVGGWVAGGGEGLLELGDGEVAVLDLVLVLFDICLEALEYCVVV